MSHTHDQHFSFKTARLVLRIVVTMNHCALTAKPQKELSEIQNNNTECTHDNLYLNLLH